VDATVLLFALAATTAAGLLFGIAPAWRASSVELNRTMKGVDSGGHTHNGPRNALAIAEIALAFVLAVGAGLMANTFWRLTGVDAGYDPHNVLTLTTCATKATASPTTATRWTVCAPYPASRASP
jgi:putative ABC transport system permease protein